MSITDELREYAHDCCARVDDAIHAIADRIDAEHQKALDEWKAKHGQMWLKGYSECHAELLEGNETLASDLERCGWIRLPKDANGEYIHIGDELIDKDDKLQKPAIVKCILYNDEGCVVSDIDPRGCWYDPPLLRHHQAPTVEDELREFTPEINGYKLMRPRDEKELRAIADRIDAEHKKACDDAWDNGYEADYLGIEKWLTEHPQVMEHHGWIRLPKDADGVPIHVGDKVTCARSVWQVTGLRLTGLAWGVCCTIFNDHGGSGTNVYPPCDLHHHHAPTVEDVLTEFGIDWEHESDYEDRVALLKEYAAKLRLAEGEDA